MRRETPHGDEAPSPSVLRIDAIHRELQKWLLRNFTHDDPVNVLTALTYEVGRIAAIGAEASDLTEAEVEQMLLGILDIMRGQIRSLREDA